jgi:hypothetical protein
MRRDESERKRMVQARGPVTAIWTIWTKKISHAAHLENRAGIAIATDDVCARAGVSLVSGDDS